MSFTELQTGKVKKIGEMTQEGVEEFCKDKCQAYFSEKYQDVTQNGFKCYESSWFEVLNDEIWRTNSKDFYVYKNGILYLVYDVKNHEDEGFFFHMEKSDSDDEYSFITQYYNGGTCLSEIIGEELEKN